MQSSLQDVCGASVPIAALVVLADLRCQPGIEVALADDRAWVRWHQGEGVLERLLAAPGVELFVKRNEAWFRLGSYLPTSDLPFEGPLQPLATVLFPAPVQPLPADARPHAPLSLHLVRSDTIHVTTALLCTLTDLLSWSEGVSGVRLASIRGARLGNQVLLLGQKLPPIVGGQRFWGEALLLPLGWRTEPELPENAWKEALALADDEIALLQPEGIEVMARRLFQPLTRASIRLAAGDDIYKV